MAFNDDFLNAGAAQNLGARSGWTFIDGATTDCYISTAGTALNNNPGTESSWICTNQATADHYTEAVCLAGGGFITIRHTNVNNFIGFRHDGTSWQVYKRNAGSFTQLGSDYTAALSPGDVARLTANGNTITFTVNGTARCLGAGVTETFNNTVQRQGVVARSSGGVPWIDDFTAAAVASGSTVSPGTGAMVFAGLAPALTVSSNRTVSPGAGSMALAGLAPLPGLPFNSSTYEFGQRTGLALSDYAIFASTSLNVSVYADSDLLLATRLFAYTETTSSIGRLSFKTNAALAAGTTYFFVARDATGLLCGCGRITAAP